MPEYVGLLISIARRRLKQAVLGRARRYRLPPQQFWTLVAVREHPGLSQKELAEELRIDAPTASRVLASLAKRKLVALEGDPTDRRRLRPRLTAAGDAAARELAQIAGEVRAAVTRGMDERELAAFRASLRKVIANMEQFDSEAATPVRAGRGLVPRRGARGGVDELADGETA